MSNETILLKALMDGTKITEFQPQNNTQAYLAYLCGADIALPAPRTNEEALLYKLCVDGMGVAQMSVGGVDLSYCSFDRAGMIAVFEGLKDVSAEGGNNNQINITGNPCVTGIAVFAAGSKFVKNHDEVRATFEALPLDVKISIKVDDEGFYHYNSLEGALDNLRGAPYPSEITWRDVTYYVKTLADEDRAIATDKGWTLVEV